MQRGILQEERTRSERSKEYWWMKKLKLYKHCPQYAETKSKKKINYFYIVEIIKIKSKIITKFWIIKEIIFAVCGNMVTLLI